MGTRANAERLLQREFRTDTNCSAARLNEENVMNRMFATMSFAMACSVAGAMAQTYPATPSDKGQTDKGKKDGTVIVTGCVAQGDTEAQFKLTNAMLADPTTKAQDKMSSDPAKPAGTTGAKPDAGMTMSYDLVGGDNLKAHLGHKIEVTGTTDTTHKMDKMSDTDRTAHKDMKGGKLTLKSFKHVSAVCP
jgi:hypothetical protein